MTDTLRCRISGPYSVNGHTPTLPARVVDLFRDFARRTRRSAGRQKPRANHESTHLFGSTGGRQVMASMRSRAAFASDAR